MPTLPLRVLNLLVIRRSIRRENLYDTQPGGFAVAPSAGARPGAAGLANPFFLWRTPAKD